MIRAAWELGRRGGGGPLPLDPTQRLVTTGPYAVLANPMQAGVAVFYAALAAALLQPVLLLGTLATLAYAIGWARPREHAELHDRFGDAWLDYRTEVCEWIPRHRPHAASAPGEAKAGTRRHAAGSRNRPETPRGTSEERPPEAAHPHSRGR